MRNAIVGLILVLSSVAFAQKAFMKPAIKNVANITLFVHKGNAQTQIFVDLKNLTIKLKKNGVIEPARRLSASDKQHILKEYSTLVPNRMSAGCKGPKIRITAVPDDKKSRSVCIKKQKRQSQGYVDFSNFLSLAYSVAKKP